MKLSFNKLQLIYYHDRKPFGKGAECYVVRPLQKQVSESDVPVHIKLK